MRDVFIWREMPDCERLKPIPANSPIAQWFYTHWGHENCIVSGTGRNAEYTPFRQRLSIKVARGGRERYFVDGRSIAVDDDSFLILNDNRTYASRFESNVEIESFSIFFRPGMAEEVYGAVVTTIERALAEGGEGARRPFEFVEALHPHDSIVSPVLRYIQYGVMSGVEDGDWYEEQFQFLLERMLAHHRRLTEQMQRLPALKTATQREIHRRLGFAVDLVHSSYEREIGLAEMAAGGLPVEVPLPAAVHRAARHHAACLPAAQARAGRRAAARDFHAERRPGRRARRLQLPLDDGAPDAPLVPGLKKRRPEGRRESIRSRRNLERG